MLTGSLHDLETIRAVPLLGVIARAADGELAFFATADSDGIPVIDNPDLERALLGALERWVSSDAVEAAMAAVDVIVPERKETS